jgi:hypothetical protein
MSRKITAARQRDAVFQGIALGFCMLERYEFDPGIAHHSLATLFA